MMPLLPLVFLPPPSEILLDEWPPALVRELLLIFPEFTLKLDVEVLAAPTPVEFLDAEAPIFNALLLLLFVLILLPIYTGLFWNSLEFYL